MAGSRIGAGITQDELDHLVEKKRKRGGQGKKR